MALQPLRRRLALLGCVSLTLATALAAAPPAPDAGGKAIGVKPSDAPAGGGATPVGEPAPLPSASRYALIVGINDYADQAVPDLQTCEADARLIHQVLTDPTRGNVPAENAMLLLGRDAGAANVKAALQRLRSAPPQATIFIYYSGHGAKSGGEAFWVTQDARAASLATSAVSDSDIRRFLDSFVAERVLMMLDCCYAAATIGAGQARADVAGVAQAMLGKGRAVLSAAGGGEEAMEDRSLGHSIFTYHLAQGLSGAADDPAQRLGDGDGAVVLPEIITYVDRFVATDALKIGGFQKPVVDMIGVQEPSKFVLTVVPGRAPQVRPPGQSSQQARDKLIADLLQQARDNDSPENGRTALDLLRRLLEMDPKHAQARELREKILDYYRPKHLTEYRNDLGMTLVFLQPDRYQRGSPRREKGRAADESQHPVFITRGLYLSRTEVTRGQFAQFVRETGYQTVAERDGFSFGWRKDRTPVQMAGLSWKNPGYEQDDAHPAVCLAWQDAMAYCQWLSKKEGQRYRLPTEAEWEYAARAGAATAYPWGDGAEGGARFANLADAGAAAAGRGWPTFPFDDKAVETCPAALYQANPWGLFDLIGNAYEWCLDGYQDHPRKGEEQVDPVGLEDTRNLRVARGGSFATGPVPSRVAARSARDLRAHRSDTGFRVALEWDEP